MKTLICASAMALTFATGATAQSEPAKSTSMVKHRHTVNDGGAEAGSNSFTEAQAQKHIAKSGFASVSALTKGEDGVWRGTAMKAGQSVNVALDFKGNVSTTSH